MSTKAMRLSELKPELFKTQDTGMLCFDCPVCLRHRIEIPVADKNDPGKAWGITGDSFENYTTTPSIAHTAYDADDDSPDGASDMC